jgi:hypothetical protein
VFDALVQDLAAAAAAAEGGGSSSSDSDEDEADMGDWAYCLELLLDMGGFASLLFDRGAEVGVRARNREVLYALSKDLERLAGKRRKAEAAAAAAAGGAAGGRDAGVSARSAEKQRAQHTPKHQEQQLQGQGKKAKKQAQGVQQQQTPQAIVANGHAEPGSAAAKHTKKQVQQQQQQEEEAGPVAPAVTPGSSHKKQTKQKHAGDKQQATPQSPPAAAGTASAAAGRHGAAAASAAKRGVKINLQQNLYFEHGAPPPAADVRTPPRSKPKGSALKSAAKLDSSGRPTSASATARRKITPSSVPRLKASEFF